MQERHYKTILYFISVVILATLAIQVYWNYKNYESGKAQLVRDVQTSLDNAIDSYYKQKATQNTMGFFGNATNTEALFSSERFKGLAKRLDSGQTRLNSIVITDELDKDGFFSVAGANTKEIDSILEGLSAQVKTEYSKTLEKPSTGTSRTTYKVFGDNPQFVDSMSNQLENRLRYNTNQGKGLFPETAKDSTLRLHALQELTTKIVLSFNDDTVEIPVVDSLVTQELARKNIKTNHELIYTRTEQDSVIREKKFDLKVSSNTELLPLESSLDLGFNNIAGIVLRRNLIGILLSIVLVAGVIGCLLYLLKIIQEQKQLAEIKNDFISNITHEFKTPIATIGAAIEGIQHFNKENDQEKTKKYLTMSSEQLVKLNTMVERILDTATLDKEKLALQKAPYNITELLENLVIKHKELSPESTIYFVPGGETLMASVDIFHMENALDNLIDNAVKYGSDPIEVGISVKKQKQDNDLLIITIKDGGSSLSREQANQIFEKFYRVPKGNTHDVKGFGIGLYYTKTIIEQHRGTITVSTTPQTTFKITLPYV